jgi:hypothetical protein
MAKDIKFKISFNGKELDAANMSLNQTQTLVSQLQQKLENIPMGTKEFKKVQKEIEGIQKAQEKAKDAGKGWLDIISSAPGLVGTFGQSLQGIGKAFGNIGMAIKTSMIGLIATIIASVVEKMKQFDGVMDPINKVLGLFSSMMSGLANAILPAVAAVVEGVATGLSKLTNLFSSSTESGKGLGDVISEMADRTNDLDDATAEYNYQQSLSNAQLADAREIAADSTKSINERKKAIDDAAKLEAATAKEGKRIALEKARLLAQQMAVDMKLTTQEIDNLGKADAVRLRSFIQQQLQNKALNGEKKDALLAQLAQINEIEAASSKIQTKASKQKQALDNEEAASARAAAKERADAAKQAADKKLEAVKAGLDAEITLEINAANTNEKTLRDLLEKKDKLANAEIIKEQERLQKKKKLTQEEQDQLKAIENRLKVTAQARDKAVADALKTDVDAGKTAVENLDKQEKEKIDAIQIASDNVVAIKQIELEKLKGLYGAESEEYKKAQNEILATQLTSVNNQLKAFKDREAAGEKFTQAEIEQINKLGLASVQLANQVVDNNKKEIAANKTKLDAKVAAQKAADDLELAQSGTTLERSMEILNARDADIQTRRDDEIAKEKEKLDKGLIDQQTYETNVLNLQTQSKKDLQANEAAKDAVKDKAFKADMDRLRGYGNALGALSELIGKDTVAGKALGIAQATINTYVGVSEVLKAKAVLPEPANTITKIASVATTIATGLKTVREIMAVKVPMEQVPEVRIRKARGGVLKGPLHQMGGITTPFGELEGGEYIINRASTQLFRPQLDMINSLGGGAVDYEAQGFAPTAGVTSEPPIFKTYVVASDMSSQQELDRVIKDRSKF